MWFLAERRMSERAIRRKLFSRMAENQLADYAIWPNAETRLNDCKMAKCQIAEYQMIENRLAEYFDCQSLSQHGLLILSKLHTVYMGLGHLAELRLAERVLWPNVIQLNAECRISRKQFG